MAEKKGDRFAMKFPDRTGPSKPTKDEFEEGRRIVAELEAKEKPKRKRNKQSKPKVPAMDLNDCLKNLFKE